MRTAKKQQLPMGLEKRLERQERSSLDSHGPHGQEVKRLVKRRFWQQLLDTSCLHFRVRQLELAHGFTQKRRFSRFYLNHCESKARDGELQRNRRRSSS